MGPGVTLETTYVAITVYLPIMDCTLKCTVDATKLDASGTQPVLGLGGVQNYINESSSGTIQHDKIFKLSVLVSYGTMYC